VSTLTDCIQAADTILEALTVRLQTSVVGWGVYKFSGTTYDSLFRFLPLVNLPAAVLVWQSAGFNREPGRPERVYHTITVLVLAEDADGEQGAAAARVQAWEVLRVLDDYTTGDVWCRCMDIAAVDLSDENQAAQVACYAVTLEVSDH